MHFFETNTIRSLGSDLIRFEFKTSHLCLVELLTGMKNEKEFSIRKKCLARIKEAECIIDPMLPEYKLFSAFGFNVKEKNENIFNGTKELIDYILSLDQFNPPIEHPHLSVLHQYDKNASNGWRNAINKRIKNKREAYSTKENSEEFILRWESDTNNLFYLNQYINFYSEILYRHDIWKTGRTPIQIAKNYDGSINRYLMAMGYYVDDKVLNNKLTAKNDYLDINHFMYLKDDETIVTNNKQLVITIEDLKRSQ